jgi:hypothetical protein
VSLEGTRKTKKDRQGKKGQKRSDVLYPFLPCLSFFAVKLLAPVSPSRSMNSPPPPPLSLRPPRGYGDNRGAG